MDAEQGRRGLCTSGLCDKPLFSKPVPNWARKVDEDPVLSESIVCAEDDFPDAATNAFVPIMGKKHFPPMIKKTGSHSMEVSCGNREIELDVYGFNAWGYTNSKDPKGNDVTGTFDSLKMDGGYTQQLCQVAGLKDGKTMSDDSKSWIRRRGGFVPTIDGGWIGDGPNGKSGDCKKAHKPKDNGVCPNAIAGGRVSHLFFSSFFVFLVRSLS